MGIVMTGISMGTLVGPLLGGILYERLGPRVPFYAGAMLAWLAFALLWKTVPRRHESRSREMSLSATASRMWHVELLSLWNRAAFRTVFITVALGGAMLCVLEPTLPVYLDRTFAAGPEMIGILFLSATAAYGLMSPLAGLAADRWNRPAIMAIGILGAAATLPWLAVVTIWTGLVTVMVVFGSCIALLLTPALPAMADAVEDCSSSGFGAAYAWFNMAYAIGMMIGTAAGGWLASHYGLFTALCAVSVMVLLNLPFVFISNRCSEYTHE